MQNILLPFPWIVALSLLIFVDAGGDDANCNAKKNVRSGAALLQVSANPISNDSFIEPSSLAVSETLLSEGEHAATLAEVRQASQGGGGKISIFTLKIKYLDHYMFWEMAIGMFLFTIAVDRLQALADHLVRDSEAGQMLLARVYGEFCMFGAVAIGLFMGNNLMKIKSATFSILEFVDILCSVACCALIFIVATLFVAHQRENKTWLEYEEADDADVGEPEGNNLGVAEYKVMARSFTKIKKLPNGFVYAVYLKECFVRDACDVMNIEWDTWAIFAVVCLVQYMWKIWYPDYHVSTFGYLWAAVFVNLACTVAHAGLLIHVKRIYNCFLSDVVALSKEGDSPTLDHPMSEKWGSRVRWALQMVSIMNTFLLAQFLMHECHNIKVAGASRLWYLGLATPLVANILLILPQMTHKLSIVEAFYGTNDEALDAVLTMVNRVQEDMLYVRMLWECRGCPEPDDHQDYDLESFSEALEKDFGLHMSAARARRLFLSFDTDLSGTVSAKEFLAGLRDEQEDNLKHRASFYNQSSSIIDD